MDDNKKRLSVPGCLYVKGCFVIEQRDTYLECNIEQGEYILVLEIDWTVFTLQKVANVTCYGP
jgi:hypothetical protein